MSAFDYRETDTAYVRAILPPGWSPDLGAPPIATWQGIVEIGRYLIPDPVPVGSQAPPAMYAAWSIGWDSFEGDFEDAGSPVRAGRLVVTGYLEKGIGLGPLRKLQEAVLTRIAAVEEADPDGPIGFTVQTAATSPATESGPWVTQNLIVHFVGG